MMTSMMTVTDADMMTWRSTFASDIVGDSPEIIEALETIRRVATTDCSILITGETGTGKELFARAAHKASHRAKKPFIPVNCAALPETLIETELFGHLKGSFTGATDRRQGRFVSAQGGTLFLDEIGDLPLAAQAKLLRVLEERVVSPVGSDIDIPVDVRIVAATHRDLEKMVEQGKFRADLYFRLAVVPMHLPSLKERGADLMQIATICMKRSIERLGRPVDGFDDSAVHAMHMYAWPGNCRELAHRMERAVLLAKRGRLSAQDLALPGTIAPPNVARLAMGTQPNIPLAKPSETMRAVSATDDATTEEITLVDAPVPTAVSNAVPVAVAPAASEPTPIAIDDSSLDLRRALEALERKMIDKALTKAGGNRTEAAALLGLNRTTLVEKLRKYAG